MSYCSQCGAEVNGPFCAQCGAAQIPDAAEPLRASASNPFEAGSQEPANPSAADSATRPPSDPSAPNIPGFFGAIPACFRKYASPHGRASRSEFWFFALWFFFALVLLIVLIKASSGPVDPVLLRRSPTALSSALTWIGWPVVLALFVPLCFSACRRLHDSDKSGRFLWFGLLIGVAVFGVALLALQAPPSEKAAEWITLGDIGYWLIFLALLFIRLAARPTPGPNKYGPQPWKRR